MKEALKATGTEFSFSVLPPHQETPFFHIHHADEEVYIILKGQGDFQVDDDCFMVTEGSVVRVAPQGKRGLHNSCEEPLVYICVQAKENSLEEYTGGDAEIVEAEPKW